MTKSELKALSFKYRGPVQMEDGFFEEYKLEINDSSLYYIKEFLNNEPPADYVELNGEQLKGRKITKEDVRFLKTIL